MATLFTSVPIVQALGPQVEEYLGSEISWRAGSQKLQHQLLDPTLWKIALEACGLVGEDELVSIAAPDAETINAFLAKHKIQVRLNPWNDPNTFGVAAVIKLLLKWLNDHPDSEYKIKGSKVAFRLASEHSLGGVNFYRNGVGEVVVEIPTTSARGYKVYVTKAVASLSHFELIYACMDAVRTLHATSEYSGVILPQFTFSDKPDVSGLVRMGGLAGNGQYWYIAQAVMGGDATFGPSGFLFRAGFAAAVRKGLSPVAKPSPKDYVVDHDVYVWIQHPQSPLPLGAVYVPLSEFAEQPVKLGSL